MVHRTCEFALFSAGFLLLSAAATGGEFTLATLDDLGATLPCRMLVRDASGQCVVPDGLVSLVTGKDRWFMSPGQCRVTVAPGDVQIRIERGTEYRRINESVAVGEEDASRTFTLRRWIDMRQRGYLTGENHLHVGTASLGPMAVAEGLDVGSSLTWWRGPDPRRPVPPGDARIRFLEFAGRTLPVSVYDAELEYAWGAAYIQNLPESMPIVAEPGRPNLDYLKHAVQRSAIVHYQGGWSREVLLDALLGYVHTVNVCNNNFALHRFQPRSRYSNLLEVQGFPVYPDTDTGMLKMNTDTYYRLLNCGLRLAAGAGSATGVKQAPVGYNRAYVRPSGEDTIDNFYAGWKAGRNFVTNGPMLFLRTASGQQPGETIELGETGGKVRLFVEALADQPIESVELIMNGRLVASFDIEEPRRVRGSVDLDIQTGAWIAARATVRDDWLSDRELDDYANPSGQTNLTVAPSRLRFAHTSPIYATVAGRGPRVQASVDEGLKMLDQLQKFVVKNADAVHQTKMQTAIDEARAKLRNEP